MGIKKILLLQIRHEQYPGLAYYKRRAEQVMASHYPNHVRNLKRKLLKKRERAFMKYLQSNHDYTYDYKYDYTYDYKDRDTRKPQEGPSSDPEDLE